MGDRVSVEITVLTEKAEQTFNLLKECGHYHSCEYTDIVNDDYHSFSYEDEATKLNLTVFILYDVNYANVDSENSELCALYAIVQKEDDYGSDNILLVKSTRQAFLDIAGLYRSKFSPKVIAVTGSVGKTTTREMIASVIKSKYNTLKTENNLNNEVGVPKTILE